MAQVGHISGHYKTYQYLNLICSLLQKNVSLSQCQFLKPNVALSLDSAPNELRAKFFQQRPQDLKYYSDKKRVNRHYKDSGYETSESMRSGIQNGSYLTKKK